MKKFVFRLDPLVRVKKTAEKQQKALRLLVRMLVCAAEQTLAKEQGKEKMEFVRNELRERGYDADTAAIEAAVRALAAEGMAREE